MVGSNILSPFWTETMRFHGKENWKCVVSSPSSTLLWYYLAVMITSRLPNPGFKCVTWEDLGTKSGSVGQYLLGISAFLCNYLPLAFVYMDCKSKNFKTSWNIKSYCFMINCLNLFNLKRLFVAVWIVMVSTWLTHKSGFWKLRGSCSLSGPAQ